MSLHAETIVRCSNEKCGVVFCPGCHYEGCPKCKGHHYEEVSKSEQRRFESLKNK